MARSADIPDAQAHRLELRLRHERAIHPNEALAVDDLKNPAAYHYVGSVNSEALSPDGTRLFSGGEDRTIRTWNLKDASSDRPLIDAVVLLGHAGAATSLVVDPGAAGACPARLIATSVEGTTRAWTIDHDRLSERTKKLLQEATRE